MAATKKFTLYWSNLDAYEKCPQMFLWKRGWGTIDTGGGPGKPKPRPLKKSSHHAVMGTVIQAAIEAMYNNELWRHPGLRETLLDLVDKEFNREMRKPYRYVDYRQCSRDEMMQTIRDGVLGYIKTFKHLKLIGPYARAEVRMLGYIKDWLPIGGIADTVIRRDKEPRKGVTILDGKNSRRYKHRKTGKPFFYTDPDQLRWYALCFYYSWGKLPDHLAFVYYRYPYGADKLDLQGEPVLGEDGEVEKEPGIVEVPFTVEDLKGLKQRAIDARRGMDREKFQANPVPRECRFCDWETVCPERQAQKQANRRSSNTDKFFDGVEGVVQFGMGPDNTVKIED